MTVENWVRRKKAAEVAGSLGTGLVALVAGCLILFLTFWFTYAILWIGMQGASAFSDLVFSHRLRLSHETRLIGAGLFIVLLFIGNARTSREDLGAHPKDDYPVTLGLGGDLLSSLGILLAHPEATSKMSCDLLYTGPRLVTGSWGLFRRAGRMRAVDVEGCGAVLNLLATCPGGVSNGALAEAFPDRDLAALTRQLRDLEWVVRLEKGLSLTHDLRTELGPLVAAPPPMETGA
jgi:hypothetical protein